MAHYSTDPKYRERMKILHGDLGTYLKACRARLRRKTAEKRDQRELDADDQQLFDMADEDGR